MAWPRLIARRAPHECDNTVHGAHTRRTQSNGSHLFTHNRFAAGSGAIFRFFLQFSVCPFDSIWIVVWRTEPFGLIPMDMDGHLKREQTVPGRGNSAQPKRMLTIDSAKTEGCYLSVSVSFHLQSNLFYMNETIVFTFRCTKWHSHCDMAWPNDPTDGVSLIYV